MKGGDRLRWSGWIFPLKKPRAVSNSAPGNVKKSLCYCWAEASLVTCMSYHRHYLMLVFREKNKSSLNYSHLILLFKELHSLKPLTTLSDSRKGKGEPSEGAVARLVAVLFQQVLLKTYPCLSHHHKCCFKKKNRQFKEKDFCSTLPYLNSNDCELHIDQSLLLSYIFSGEL